MPITSEHASIHCLRALCFCHTYHASVAFKHSVKLFMHVVMAKSSDHICMFVNYYADGHILQTSTRGVSYEQRTANRHYIVEVIHRQKPPSFSMQRLYIYFCHPKRSLFDPAYLLILGLCVKLMSFWSIETIKNTHNLWWTNKEPSICPLDKVQTQLSKNWKWRKITI